jgi:hypothetical protein
MSVKYIASDGAELIIDTGFSNWGGETSILVEINDPDGVEYSALRLTIKHVEALIKELQNLVQEEHN